MGRMLLGFLPATMFANASILSRVPLYSRLSNKIVLYAVSARQKSLTSTDTGAWAYSPPVHTILNVAEATSQEYGSANILLW